MLHRALDLVYLTLAKRLLVRKLIRVLCFNNEVELGLFAVPQVLPSKNNAEIRIVGADGGWNLAATAVRPPQAALHEGEGQGEATGSLILIVARHGML